MILGHLLPAVNAGSGADLPARHGSGLLRKPPLASPRAAHRANRARRGPGARSQTAARTNRPRSSLIKAYNPGSGCLDGGTHEAKRHSAVARARDTLRLPGAAIFDAEL